MPKNQAKPWFSVKNAITKPDGGKTVEAFIYGDITSLRWYENDVESKSFIDSLIEQEPFDNLDLHINSPGGDYFEGMAISSFLNERKYHITSYGDGLIASAATLPFLAANKRIIQNGAYMVIHKPVGSANGINADEMRDGADKLDKIEKSLIENYKAKSNLDDETLSEMVKKETWMGAEEAVKLGFADEISGFSVAACISDDKILIGDKEFDVSNFKNRPTLPKMAVENIKPKEEEKVMDLEKLKTEHPDIYNQILQDGKTQGAAEATAREEGFLAIANSVDKDFLTECKDKGMTAEATALEAVKQGKVVTAASTFMANAKIDNQTTGGVKTDSNEPTTDEDKHVLGAVKNFFKGGNK